MSDIGARMQVLRDRFRAAAAGQAETLEQAAGASDWDQVRIVAHGLAGRSAMFDHSALGELALALEEAIEHRDQDVPARLNLLIEALRAVDQER